LELSGFNPSPSYALRSPTQAVTADAAFGAAVSKRPVESSAQAAKADEKASPNDGPDGQELTKEQEDQVRDLKKRDAEVKAHEQAHAAVGGAYASAPSYTYTKGPDGKKYAVGGEVQIDTSPERTPEATIRKMDVVIRAALAPAEPSSQDQAVARQAQTQRQQAQSELQAQQAEEQKPEEGDDLGGALGADLVAQIIGSRATESQVTGSLASAATQAYTQAASLFGAAA
jgi:hypothetical protein